MGEAKFVVGHCEHPRGEFLGVGLACTGDVAGAPASIDDLPLAVINFDCVPGVIGILGGEWDTWFKGFVTAEAFAVAAYDNRFHASFSSYGCVEACVAFAHGKTGIEGGCGGGGFEVVTEEGDDVVCHIVVEPGEDTAGLVGGRGERGD